MLQTQVHLNVLNVTVTGDGWRGQYSMVTLPTNVHEKVEECRILEAIWRSFSPWITVFTTLQGWSPNSSSHGSGVPFQRCISLHPAWWHHCFYVAPFSKKMQMIVFSNANESKLIFWVVCARFPEGDRELWKPCSNSVTVKLWHKRLFVYFCWVIQRVTESHFLHVNFLKESARHVFLVEMFGSAYAKYYNIQALMSFVFFPFISSYPQEAFTFATKPHNSISEII